ncbi:type 1 glutamine amidotransferase domain-containing protein [Micromonospora sp. CPCC 205539]|uniref:type 1 glutamine amidotransferase domain-containing protein n=1 Tax=Micromonospora sp. CPCC 205539 TaxID=3122408 RepID=UPI002FF0BEE8
MAGGVLSGYKVAFLATDMVDRSELVEPWTALADADADVELVSIRSGRILLSPDDDEAETFPVDRSVTEVSPADYDALVLPGGVRNLDTLRTDEDAVEFVRHFFEAGKPVGAICHALWLLIEADVARGRTLTSWPSLRTDLLNAGAVWCDEQVIVDGNLVTSRKPDDVPAFTAEVVELFASRASAVAPGRGAWRQPTLCTEAR